MSFGSKWTRPRCMMNGRSHSHVPILVVDTAGRGGSRSLFISRSFSATVKASTDLETSIFSLAVQYFRRSIFNLYYSAAEPPQPAYSLTLLGSPIRNERGGGVHGRDTPPAQNNFFLKLAPVLEISSSSHSHFLCSLTLSTPVSLLQTLVFACSRGSLVVQQRLDW